MFPPETHILVIDDMPSIRDLVKSRLKTMGYKQILEAADGEEGLALLEIHRSKNPVQLVISDWNMPKLTGLALLRQVRERPEWKNLPFVLLTSEAEREQVAEAVLAGASQYIVKPFAAKTFEEKLTAVWNKHNPAAKA